MPESRISRGGQGGGTPRTGSLAPFGRMNPDEPTPPTNEKGQVLQYGHVSGSPYPNFFDTSFFDDSEVNPLLLWPNSVEVFRGMKQDAQIQSLMAGMTLPIRRWKWMIDPNGAPDNIVRQLADDVGLPLKGEAPKPIKRTRKNDFVHDEHLRLTLDYALTYGHYVTEAVGEIVDGRWKLNKLAPRPPKTIQQWYVDNQGQLLSIQQEAYPVPIYIPAGRLAVWVLDMEPGSWIGRSMLRPLYKHWFIKDRLLRIDAMKQERNGMGVPIITAPPGATPDQIKEYARMAQRYKVGESSGGALPDGAELKLVGTSGTVPETITSIRYHDEAMARALLMMFLQLGQTRTGSRALGETFVDFFRIAQETLGYWYTQNFNQQVIEPWMEWNHGDNEEFAPRLCYEVSGDNTLAIADMVALIDSGAIIVDAELEHFLRDQYGLPFADPGHPLPTTPTEPPGQSTTVPDAPRAPTAPTNVDPTSDPSTPVGESVAASKRPLRARVADRLRPGRRKDES